MVGTRTKLKAATRVATAASGDAVRATRKGRAPAPRTHQERREEARKRILDAAYAIVVDGGIDQLTLARVGEAAGYSRALPAHYFESKEALIGALAERIMGSHARHMAHFSAGKGGLTSLLTSVGLYIDQPLSEPDTIRAFHAFLAATFTRAILAPAARYLNSDAVGRIARLIEQGQERGEIRALLDPEVQARAILGSLRGIVTQWLQDPEGFPLAQVRDAYIEQLRSALSN